MMPKIFLDSSVIIAATLSSSGGSFRLCRESREGRLQLLTNRYVCDEVAEVLTIKYPSKLGDFRVLIEWGRIGILKNSKKDLVKKAAHFIEKEDAPVLAGALEAKADFLISLDRRDFFTDALHSAKLPIIIATPKMFFQEYWPDFSL